MSAQIFISHSSKDVAAARTILQALESRDLTCWMSGRDVNPGENFMSAIVPSDSHFQIMVLAFSESSDTSPEVAKELALAGQYQLTVMPVRIEDVTPSDAIAYALATSQWTDLFNDWNRGIERLATSIVTLNSLGAAPIVAFTQPTARPDPLPLTVVDEHQPPTAAAPGAESRDPAAAPVSSLGASDTSTILGVAPELSRSPRGLGVALVVLGLVRLVLAAGSLASVPPSYREAVLFSFWRVALLAGASLVAGVLLYRGAAAARGVGFTVGSAFATKSIRSSSL